MRQGRLGSMFFYDSTALKCHVIKDVPVETPLCVTNGNCFFLWFRFTDHAYQYASTPKATSAPLGCIHSYYPYP